ncbi:putative membrane protein [Mesorhizobium sp. J18]|uniref:DUF421 domain-containing protein n=1 Tax=Mesorhizobium sp. J18 TaxID=935263 RepID=UPI001199BE7A|nr:YetF domain-containing protein [Mesorhizobium sp. J18]TWG98505.1 putative membrane protein [Mesorhizobium sp. J18]
MSILSEISRILFGESDTAHIGFFVEVALRTVVMYFYTIFLARMVGQSGVGQIGPFEFVLVIAVGSAAGDPMLYPDVALLHGIIVITVVILLHRATASILNRDRKLEERLEGVPILVVEKGKVKEEVLGSGSLTKRELMSLLRIEGIRNTGEVEHAWFEPAGRLSIFRVDGRARKGENTLPDV